MIILTALVYNNLTCVSELSEPSEEGSNWVWSHFKWFRYSFILCKSLSNQYGWNFFQTHLLHNYLTRLTCVNSWYVIIYCILFFFRINMYQWVKILNVNHVVNALHGPIPDTIYVVSVVQDTVIYTTLII